MAFVTFKGLTLYREKLSKCMHKMAWKVIAQDNELLLLGFGEFGKQISNRCVAVVTLECTDYIWTKSCTGHVILLTFLIHF